MQKQETSPSVVMGQNHPGNGLLEKAAGKALARLARFSSLEESNIRQTFLFAANRLCGVRLDAGPFQASWQFDAFTIQITRDRQIVDQFAFPDAISKAA